MIVRVAVLVVAVVALAGCGESYRGEPLHGSFPARAAVDGSPSDAAIARLEAGHIVFDRHCDHCHPGGSSGLAPAINNKPAPGWFIRFQVRNGMGAMPAFSQELLPDDDLDALVEYLVALRRHGGAQ